MLVATTATIVFGSVSAPITAQAATNWATAPQSQVTGNYTNMSFLKEKTKKVTPTIKSAKRNKKNSLIKVTITVPKSKVKKLGNTKKVEVAFTNNNKGKGFDGSVMAKLNEVKAKKKGTNQYTLEFKNYQLAGYKNAYIAVRFKGKSNWSKLVKVSGSRFRVQYVAECLGCHKKFTSYESMYEARSKHSMHADKIIGAFEDSITDENGYTNPDNFFSKEAEKAYSHAGNLEYINYSEVY